MNSLATQLEERGFRVWFDQFKGIDPTKEGMRQGVQGSGCFVLFLSKGVAGRPWVHFEIGLAKEMNKTVVLLHEAVRCARFWCSVG